MNKSYIFDLGITIGGFENIQSVIIDFVNKKEFASVFFANVHMLVEAKLNTDFSNIVNNADIVAPDGVPVCFALKLLNHTSQTRIAGMDFLPIMLNKASSHGIPVYFYGSTDTVLERILEKCTLLYPQLKIAGYYSPPFNNYLSLNDETQIIERFNSSNAGIIFVALGCPKQEKFIHSLRGKVNSVMIGVGGAFPVFAGTVKRSPIWMQKWGLEWFFRLLQEPMRLFNRYFSTNTFFIYLLVSTYIKRHLKF